LQDVDNYQKLVKAAKSYRNVPKASRLFQCEDLLDYLFQPMSKWLSQQWCIQLTNWSTTKSQSSLHNLNFQMMC